MQTPKFHINRVLGPYRLSHHPLCEQFQDHVYLIRGRKFCRGCVMQYSGIIVFILILVIGSISNLWSGISDIQVGLVLYFLVFATLVATYLVRNRVVKDIARFLLGVSFSLAITLWVFTPDLLVKGWILLNFIPGYIYLNKKRSRNNNLVCIGCEEFKRQPVCSGYQIYSDREKIFLGQAVHGGIRDPFALSPEQLED